MRALLIGNYGVGNLGDEALREYFQESFSDIDWTVLSASPQKKCDVPRLPLGLRSLLTTPWWKTVFAYAKTDIVVFGGGSLFTDSESVVACFLWGLHALLAFLLQKPVILAAQGIGPFRTRVGEGISHIVCRRSAFISVRDEASYHRLESWQMSTQIVQTFDPVFLFFLRHKVSSIEKNVFIAIPRMNSDAMFFELYNSSLSKHDFDEVKILSMHPGDARERRTIHLLQEARPNAVVLSVRTAEDLLAALADAKMVLCQRFHGALAALALGKMPVVVPLAAGDKLSALAEDLERGGGDVLLHHWQEQAEDGEAALRQVLHRFESRSGL